MQALGPSEEDKKAARQHALLTAGLGMMANSTGPTMVGIGRGGLLGQNAYNQELQFNNQQRTANMAQINAYQNLAMQMQNRDMMAKALNGGGQPETQPGPPQAFQAPGGASALMGAGAAGQDPTANSLPTQVQAPPNPMALRDRLVNANLINTIGGGKDLSAAIKMKYPDIIPLRAGAGAYDPATQKVMPNPAPPPGYYYDVGSNSFVKVKNAAEAEASAQSIPKAVAAAYEPQIGVLPGGGEGVVGNKLDTMFGGGPLPYGAPSPYKGRTAAAQAAGEIPPPGVAMKDWLAAKADAANNPGSEYHYYGAGNTPMPVQTKLSPEQAAQSKNLGEYEQEIHKSATVAGQSQGKLNTLGTMFDRFTPGPTMPLRSGIASYAQEVPGVGRAVADALVPNSAQALPAIAAVKKLAVEMTAEQSKVFGSREGQQVIGMIKSALPSIESVPGAPQIIMQSLAGINKYHIDTEQAVAAWKADPAHNGSLEGFQETWNKTNPPSNYVPMDKLEAIVGGAPQSQSAPTLSPKAQGNKTAQVMIQNVLKSGDAAKIQELRTLGWIK